ncbi:TadA family conjugal transfer-associated ATPase [Aeromicrobium sp. CF3.5]|uniref:TadA family conjugal transfer-associated ATPase n=1 Tax=Aeromicrobium sp. CF3.5 TaxID=3373078 RepID=UPI003EE537C3
MSVSLIDRVRHRLVMDGVSPTAATVADALRSEQQVLGSGALLNLVDRLCSEMLGAGPLDALLALPGITDVLVNGPGQVLIDRGQGLELTDVRFESDDIVRRLAQRMAAVAGRRLDDAAPWVDARLPDGTRLHAVLAPLSRPGTVISLRVPARVVYSIDDLAALGMFAGGAEQPVRSIARARASFVVTGGTGSGKTTVLAAMLGLVDPHERLVLVEDSTELRPDHPHVVGLEARPPNVEGAGGVTVRDLVRQALRMRPDRLVVGEVRGHEVVDLLAALNTGHEGGCGTVHANSAVDVPARFEALGVAAGLPRDAVHSQLAAGLDLVIHLDRDSRGVRRVREIAVLVGRDGWVQAVTALTFDTESLAVSGPGIEAFRALVS